MKLTPLICPHCHGQMKVIAFITDYSAVDRIINHLKLTFKAERPPPSQLVQQELLMAAEDPGANIIWVGCTFLMIGLAFAFYWPTREIKIILEEYQDKTQVIAGGIASKDIDVLQSEFEKIMISLRRLTCAN